jgi:hypothetical protein
MSKVAQQSGNNQPLSSDISLIHGSNSLNQPSTPIRKARTVTGGNSLDFSDVASSLETPARTYLDNAVPNAVTRQRSEAVNLPSPNKRRTKYTPNYEILAQKTQTKNRLARLFREAGKPDVSDKMRDCSNFFDILTTGQCIEKTVTTFYCSSRHCPFCAAIRVRERQEEYLPKFEAFARLNPQETACHLVITQKPYRGESLISSIKRLLSNFRKLIRREVWKEYFDAGGCYSVEFTKGRGGCWHTHLHLAVFRSKFLNVKQFRAAWLDVTGDSVNFKIKRIDTLAGGLEEVIGYISKPQDVSIFTVADAEQLLELKGVKLFGTFGRFRKFCADYQPPEPEPLEIIARMFPTDPLIEGDLCECCGLTLFRLRVDIRQRIELEKQVYMAKRQTRGKPPINFRC